LMQTELHHIQTLTVMSEVFRRGMLEELQLDWDCVARIFPCLDPLLLFHRNLFKALQECRQAATQAENSRNYLIHHIGNVLLQQIRDIITAVDLMVGKYERSQELQEVLARLETKSFAKLKNDKVFRKQDLNSKHRALQHKGLLYWKTATGRLKDTLALLLTDVLVFLQEKDQRFIFASVDQKPPVIPLQKLIVREVANEERGMFLISASSVGPEMYEVHTTTKEERNAWMRHIRQAVESCPEEEEEEERSAETEEARQAAEMRAQKISKFQETLLGQDQQICHSLEEKLQLYAELTELTLRAPESVPHRHLLVGPAQYIDTEAPHQASSLLTAALREG
ncbi:hypothetical protein GOODEAATRI_032524, partial [Goodea atripinnis]